MYITFYVTMLIANSPSKNVSLFSFLKRTKNKNAFVSANVWRSLLAVKSLMSNVTYLATNQCCGLFLVYETVHFRTNQREFSSLYNNFHLTTISWLNWGYVLKKISKDIPTNLKRHVLFVEESETTHFWTLVIIV